MKKIPEKIAEIYDRLMNDFSYFEYALLNGGAVGLIAIPVFFFFLWWVRIEIRRKRR